MEYPYDPDSSCQLCEVEGAFIIGEDTLCSDCAKEYCGTIGEDQLYSWADTFPYVEWAAP